MYLYPRDKLETQKLAVKYEKYISNTKAGRRLWPVGIYILYVLNARLFVTKKNKGERNLWIM